MHALIGQKHMLYQSIKHRKAGFIVLCVYNLWLVFSTFPLCSQTPVVLYHIVMHGLGFFTKNSQRGQPFLVVLHFSS